MGILRKFYGNTVVLMAAAGRRGVSSASSEKLNRMRDRRTRWLVRYAARTVPYYREWFSAQSVDPRDIRTAEDLSELPLLEKSMVSANPDQFRSQSHHGRRAIRFKTSGSTGLPLRIYHDRRSILENIAFSEPERAVAMALLGNKRGYRVLRINRPESTMGEVQEFCALNTLIPGRPQYLRMDVEHQPSAVVERIRKVKPDVLAGYGSYLEQLFRYIHERGIEMPMPRLVSYGADGMSSSGRALISGTMGVPVIASFNAVECFKIGFQCGGGPNFHLHEDLCHVRIVGENGSDLPLGQPGEVVISNLVNRGTVLFNYRLGDIAALSGTSCDCGRSLKLLGGLDGRVLDAMILPGGSFIHAGAVWSVLSKGEGVLRYQLIQHDFDEFELKLVTVDEGACKGFRERVLPELQSMLGPAARIDVRRHEQLFPGPSGKFRPIVSNCRHGRDN